MYMVRPRRTMSCYFQGEHVMGHGKNAAGSKKIARAPATKFAQLQKKAIKNRKPIKNRAPTGKPGKTTKGK